MTDEQPQSEPRRTESGFEVTPDHRAYNGFFRWACGHESKARDWPDLALWWPRNGVDGGIGGPFVIEGWTPVIVVGIPEIVCHECSLLSEGEHRERVIGLMGRGYYSKSPLGWPRRPRGDRSSDEPEPEPAAD